MPPCKLASSLTIRLAISGALATGALSGCGARLEKTGFQTGYRSTYGEQLWLIPSPTGEVMMRTLLFKPRGRGPFPLAIVNHGSNEDPAQRSVRDISQFILITNWLVQRGYIVALLERPGHGETGGTYLETQGNCDEPNYEAAGLATARIIRSALEFLQKLDFVQRGGAIVIGYSAGGWGALALASQQPRDVSAMIVFAAGRGGHAYNKPNMNCAPSRLIEAAGSFGRTAVTPTLWLYAENDTYFSPTLAQNIFDAFHAGGAEAEFHLLPPSVGEDGHFAINSASQLGHWESFVSNFLSRSAANGQAKGSKF